MNLSKKDITDSRRGWRNFFRIGAIIAAAIGLIPFIRWLRKNGFKLFHHQGGFTLMETVIAVVIISFIGIAVVKAIDTNARSIRTLDEKVQATNLITSYLESIRQLAYDDTANPYASVNGTVTKPTQYIVTMSFAYSPDGNSWYSATTAASTNSRELVSRFTGRGID